MANKEWMNQGVDGLQFGERLEDLIKLNHTTAAAVARETGVPQSGISEYINGSKKRTDGRSPDCANIIALAKHFSVSTDYLLGLTNVKTPSTDTQAIIKETGLSEGNVLMLKAMQSENLFANINMANDLLSLVLDSDIIIHYLLMETTLSLPAPSSWFDQLKSTDTTTEDLAFIGCHQREHGYVQLSGKEALEYHCSKIADLIEQALINKYKAVAKWEATNGND